MSKVVISLFLLILSTSVISSEKISYIDSRTLSQTDRLNLINSYKKFLISLENQEEVKSSKLYSTIIFEKIINNFLAYAEGVSDCVYAGWPSIRGSSGYCNRPDTISEYTEFQSLSKELGFETDSPVGFEKCSVNQRQCNPIIFGPVCVPFDTKYNRVRATSNCDKESLRSFPNGFDYKNFIDENVDGSKAQKALEFFNSNMDKLQQTSNNVCNDPNNKQSRTAVCRVLASRLKADFPYHSNGGNRSTHTRGNTIEKRPISEESIKDLENEINSLNIDVKSVLSSKECIDPSVARVVDKRYNTIRLIDPKSGDYLSDEGSECIKKLKPLLDARSAKLEEYERILSELEGGANSCNEIDPLESQLAIEKQITEMNRFVAEKACEENPQKWTAKGCGKDFACAIGSSLFFGGPLNKVGALVGKKLGFDEGCLNSQNNCLAKIATAAVDVVWSFLQSIPDIAKMAWNGVKNGVKWIGKKAYNWMNWASDTEKKLSDANQSGMNKLGKDEESSLSKIGNFFSEMWTMLKEYVTHDLMCTEPGWETERFSKNAQCDAPFVSWNCLTCAGAISGACNVIGAVGSEVIIGILSGGTATGVKAGAKAISVGVKASTRLLLKNQFKGLTGAALRSTGKGLLKIGKGIRAPSRITGSISTKAKVFFNTQKNAFRTQAGWVRRNINKVATPVVARFPKSQFVKNVAELTVEGAKKVSGKAGRSIKNTLLFPFKVPKYTLNVVGRALDPFNLGKLGFGIGMNAAHGLLPMAHFLRVTNFSYDLSRTINELNKVQKAQKTVDLSMNLMKKASSQMDEWIKAAQKGTLTQEEFKQLQKVLEIQDGIKAKVAGDAKALERFENISKKFDTKAKQLGKILGEAQTSRYMKYSDDIYTGLKPNKVRSLKTGKEKAISSIEVLRKEAKDVVIITKPKNQNILILDKVDSHFVGVTRTGEKVLISSASLDKNAARFINKKLNAIKIDDRLAQIAKLEGKGGATKTKKIISLTKKSDDFVPISNRQKVKNKIVNVKNKVTTPITSRISNLKLRNRIKTASEKADVLNDVKVQASLEKDIDRFVKETSKVKRTGASLSDFKKVANQIKTLNDASSVANPALKTKIVSYIQDMFSKLPSQEAKNIVANQVRDFPKKASFGSSSANTVSFYKKGNLAEAKLSKSIEANVTSRINKNEVFIRIDKNGVSEGVRVVDETPNSFAGYKSDGTVVHIKKTALGKKSREGISRSIAKVDPLDKEKLFNRALKSKNNRVYPKNDPDFIYQKQLAAREIRVGDDIVKLRKFQVGTERLRESLVDGGAVVLKDKRGIAIKVNNIYEEGNYWIGFSKSNGERVIIPKFLMESKANNLMRRGFGFTKFKKGVGENLGFITKYFKKTKKIDVDKAFRKKYKYINYSIKYNMTKNAISKLDPSTLEQISDKVYLRAINDSEAEILYTPDEVEVVSEEEQTILDKALEESVSNEQYFDFDDADESDFDF